MEPSRKKRKVLYRRYLRDDNEPLPRTTRYRMDKIDPLDDEESSNSDWSEDGRVYNNSEQHTGHILVESDEEEGRLNNEPEQQSLDEHTTSDSDGTGASMDSEQDTEHIVEDSDEEESRLNDELHEQSLDEHTNRDSESLDFDFESLDEHTNSDSDGTGASMDSEYGYDVDNSDEEDGRLNDKTKQPSLDDHTNRDSEGLGLDFDFEVHEEESRLNDEPEQFFDAWTDSDSSEANMDSDLENPLSSHTDDYDGGDDTTSDAEHMVNDDMMRSPLYQGALVTLGQTILLLMAFAVIVGLTQDAYFAALILLSSPSRGVALSLNDPSLTKHIQLEADQ